MDQGRTRHHLLLELGRGGMGTVYLAVSRGPGGFSKLKVVKRLRADLANDDGFLSMFLDEARLAARLHHSNIVQTNEVGFDGAYYFIEMEYLDGQSYDALYRRAGKSGGLALELSLHIIAQTLAGLHYAHELKDHAGQPLRIVHRDVSPHNVFITYDGAVKVLDFGIAKAADSTSETTTGVVKGKATYMAPEQSLRGAVDRRADVFAAGVMLWEALTRKRLWAGLSDFEIFLALQKSAPPPPRAIEPNVDAAFDAICAKALAFEPEHRFATAAEMQRALEDEMAAHGMVVGARQLARAMDTLFAERRAAVEAEISARLAEMESDKTQSGRTSVDVPLLHQAKGVVETATGPTRPTRPTGPAMAADTKLTPHDAGADRTRLSSTTDVDARQRRGRWRLFAVACATAAAVATGVLLLRSRLDRGAAPTASSRSTLAPGACRSHADCGKPGVVCNRSAGTCVPLSSDACVVDASDAAVADDGTLWIGALLPRKGPNAEAYGTMNANALLLARKDFDLLARAGVRPVGLLLCDDSDDASAAARHLVDVGAPVVIGFGGSTEGIDLTTHVFQPAGVLVLNALFANEVLASVGEQSGGPRLAWLTTITANQLGRALAYLTHDFAEPLVRARGDVEAGAPIRVAFIRNNLPFAFAAADPFLSAVRFNDAGAVQNAPYFRQIIFDAGDASADTGVVNALLEFEPHVIVALNPRTMYARVLASLESKWPHGAGRPLYLLPEVLTGDALYAFVGKSAERRHRFFGVDLPASTQANLKFVLRYNEAFSPHVTLGTSPGVMYDNFYLAALAGSLGDLTRPPAAADVARALSRFTADGVAIEVGPMHIDEARAALRQGKNVDLHGAGLRLALQPETGGVESDLALYCLGTDAAGKANDSIESGVTWSFVEKRVSGELRCP